MMSMGVRILLFFFLGVNLAQAQQKPELPAAFLSVFPKSFKVKVVVSSDSLKTLLVLADHNVMPGQFDTIRAYIIKEVGAEVQIKSIVDFISKEKLETTIRFVTKACAFLNDSTTLVTYQTYGPNGADDGRVKLILYVGDQKVGIRHQNGVLDFQRYTQVDPALYNLPSEIQSEVKSVLIRLETDGEAIFPSNWQEAMAAKQTMIKEN